MDKNVNKVSLEERLYEMASPDAPVGLAFLRDLLELLDAKPDFRCIHVAGTNGKGSLCACMDSILHAEGYKCAMFTSPHLERLTERLTMDGMELPENEWSEAFDSIEEALKRASHIKLPYFSILTAAAFILIKRHSPDVVVLETGLGGTYDGTNVVEKPLLSVITPIGLDHTAILGGTVEQIAESKFGIVKPGCRALFCGCPESLDSRFMEVCREKGAAGEIFTRGCRVTDVSTGTEGTRFEYENSIERRKLFVRLPGIYQAQNAALAVRALELLSDVLPVTKEDIDKGLARVRWPGRMEVLSENPEIILDGAHNPHGIEALSKSLLNIYGHGCRISFVFAAMKDKDYATSLKMLAECFPSARLYCIDLQEVARAESAQVISEIAGLNGWQNRVKAYKEMQNCLREAEKSGGPVVICGSLYLIGILREKLIAKRQTKFYYNS